MSVWKWHFPFFCIFLSDKVEPFPGKSRKSIQNCLNSKFVIESILEKDFGATLRSIVNVLSIRKSHFSLFGRFLSDKVENIFWECFQNYLNSKFVVASILEYSFQATFMPKMNFLSVLRCHFSFFGAFGVRKLKLFSGKAVYSWISV